MASFWFLLLLITSLTIFPLLSSSVELISQRSTLSTSPGVITESPFQELSPDITPLLPTPGGVLPPPTISSIPTIPSSPSPPNPDDLDALGPGSAFSPFGLPLASSSVPRKLASVAISVGCDAFCLIALFLT